MALIERGELRFPAGMTTSCINEERRARGPAGSPTTVPRSVLALVLAWACLWHAAQLAGGWREALEGDSSGDFASYYYAARVAAQGGDPYDRSLLVVEARGQSVHPYLYPPPFLAAMQWTRAVDLAAAHRAWFWMNELCLWLALLCLWRWWRPLGPEAIAIAAGALALHAGTLHNHVLGQANLPVFAMTIAGIWLEQRGRQVAAGVLVGLATAIKIVPAVFLAWWWWRGRRAPVVAAVGAIAAAFAAAGAIVGWDLLHRFAFGAIPDLLTGQYGGLAPGVGMFGNHSLTSVTHALWPPEAGAGPSAGALGLAAVSGVALLAGVAWLMRTRQPAVPVQVALIAPLTILLPIYGFEHYLVWALPTVVISVLGIQRRELGRRWLAVLIPAWTIWVVDVSELKRAASALPVLDHAKPAALLVLLAACGAMAWSGRTSAEESVA